MKKACLRQAFLFSGCAYAREVRWYQYARRSWLHPDEIGTLGWFARSFASTQRARARRDHVGKNWRESARAWAKLWIFMSFSVGFVTLQRHHGAGPAYNLSPWR